MHAQKDGKRGRSIKKAVVFVLKAIVSVVKAAVSVLKAIVSVVITQWTPIQHLGIYFARPRFPAMPNSRRPFRAHPVYICKGDMTTMNPRFGCVSVTYSSFRRRPETIERLDLASYWTPAFAGEALIPICLRSKFMHYARPPRIEEAIATSFALFNVLMSTNPPTRDSCGLTKRWQLCQAH